MRYSWILIASLLACAAGCAPIKSAQRSNVVEFAADGPVERSVLVARHSEVAALGTMVRSKPAAVARLQPQVAPPVLEEIAPPPVVVGPQGYASDPGLRPINQITVDISAKPPPRMGEINLPRNLAAEQFPSETYTYSSEPFQPWGQYQQFAAASNFCHQPLYFEDVNLERYGNTWGVAQPFVSTGKFFATIPALPYLIASQPPKNCIQDGGYPAGAPAPRQAHVPPWNNRAALVQAATVVGIILLFP